MNKKKYLIIPLLLISFIFISTQKISENKKDNSKKLYPINPVDFSQNMLVYIKSELPYKSYLDTLENIDLNKLIQVAQKAETILGYTLPGQVMHAGPRLKKYSVDNVPTATGG